LKVGRMGEERTCHNVGCDKTTTSGGKACSVCRVTVYCGKECLKKHAKVHKKECAAIAKQAFSKREAKDAAEVQWAHGIMDRTMAKFQKERRPHFVALSCYAWMRQREMGQGACIFRVVGGMCQENLLVIHVVSIGEMKAMARRSKDARVWDRALRELEAVDVSRGFKIELDLDFEPGELRRWRGQPRMSPMVEYAVPDGDACAEHAKLIVDGNLHERFQNSEGGFFEVIHLEPFMEGVKLTDALLEEATRRAVAKKEAAAAEGAETNGKEAGDEGTEKQGKDGAEREVEAVAEALAESTIG